MLLKASPTPCLVTNALIWVSQRQPCPEKRKLTKSYESKLVYPLRPKAHRAECAFHFSRQCYHCSRERWLNFKTTKKIEHLFCHLQHLGDCQSGWRNFRMWGGHSSGCPAMQPSRFSWPLPHWSSVNIIRSTTNTGVQQIQEHNKYINTKHTGIPKIEKHKK